jgi:transcriptional regulator with XRE-family HTH domain
MRENHVSLSVTAEGERAGRTPEPGSVVMSTVVAEKLRGINRGGFRATDVAQLLGTRPETVSRWNAGRNQPQGDSLRRLLELEYIVQRLGELYTPEEARLWIFQRHKALGGRTPAELIRDGRMDEVLRAIDQLADGVFV